MKAMKRKKIRVPRFGDVAIAQILLLRDQGKSLAETANSPFVRKKDGTRPSQQAVWYVCQSKILRKRQGKWVPKEGQGAGGGRPEKLTAAQKQRVIKLIKKYRFQRIRVPWVRKKLRLAVSDRTIRRVVNESGYRLLKKKGAASGY